MRILATGLVALMLASAFAFSQEAEHEKGRQAPPTTNTEQAPETSQSGGPSAPRGLTGIHGAEIPASAEIHATLDTPLSSRTSRAGDRFTATLSEPLRNSSGVELIPAGSKLMGEISGNSDHSHNELRMRFTEITLPTGQKVPIAASLGMNEVNLPAETPLVLKLEKAAMMPAAGK